MSNLVITEQPEFKGFCEICGLPLLPNEMCKRYHKIKNPNRKKYSGKSKSPNRWNNV